MGNPGREDGDGGRAADPDRRLEHSPGTAGAEAEAERADAGPAQLHQEAQQRDRLDANPSERLPVPSAAVALPVAVAQPSMEKAVPEETGQGALASPPPVPAAAHRLPRATGADLARPILVLSRRGSDRPAAPIVTSRRIGCGLLQRSADRSPALPPARPGPSRQVEE